MCSSYPNAFCRAKQGRSLSNTPLNDSYEITKSPSLNEDAEKSPQKEDDPSYVIQERPGMFPYPYHINPGKWFVISCALNVTTFSHWKGSTW